MRDGERRPGTDDRTGLRRGRRDGRSHTGGRRDAARFLAPSLRAPPRSRARPAGNRSRGRPPRNVVTARTRGRRACRSRPDQPPDRRRAGHQRTHGRRPRRTPARKTRRPQPRRSRRLGHPERSRPRPDSLKTPYRARLPITSVVSAPRQIRFADDDMARFSDASWDRNPLHLSADYARRTPYGERVVFGVLGLLRALEHSAPRQTQLSRITADFQSPLFLGVAYDVHIAEDSPTRLRASVHDGRDLVMSFTAEFSDGPAPLLTPAAPTAPPRHSAAQHTTSSIVGASASGSYYPRESRDLTRQGLSQQHVAALTWCSYLIGMELPGERALFSRLVLSFAATSAAGPLAYQATVKNFDDRFNLARIGATLWIGGAMFAEGELRAFVREDVPRRSAAELSSLLPPSDA